jgi:hypothetical protein
VVHTSRPTESAVVVAHRGVTTDVLRTLLGDDELNRRAPTVIVQGISCCAITTLKASADTWLVGSIAVTDHLDERRSEHRPAG